MAIPATGPSHPFERHRRHVARQRTEHLGTFRQADEVEQWHAGHDAERGVQRVADRLGAVRRGRPDRGGVGGRSDPRQQGPPDARALGLGHDEQHREVPQPFPEDGRGERHDPFTARGFHIGHDGGHEALGVGRAEVAVQAHERARVGGQLRDAESADVVVDAVPPDLGTGGELVLGDRPVGQRLRRQRRRVGGRGHAASPSLSPPRHSPPVARRSSSACMKGSSSPSRTALVLPVSWAVRRSLTIW